MLSLLPVLSLPVLAVIAAVKDVISYTIPNWISLAMAGGFLIAAPLIGLGWSAFGLHLAVGLGALFLGMAGFALGWFGGGDAKMFAAAALWMGWPDVVSFLFFSALFGGVLTLALIAARKLTPPRLMAAWPSGLLQENAAVPYGVALAAGVLITLPGSAVFTAATGI